MGGDNYDRFEPFGFSKKFKLLIKKIHIMQKITLSLVLFIAFSAIFSCTPREVTRIDPDRTIDLSGRWNSTDAQQTADAMISQVLNANWLPDYRNAHDGDKPVLIVGFVENKTHEHIDPEVFIRELEKEFINSGRVTVVQGGEKREEIRSERAGQQEYAAANTISEWGKEIGANFIIQGEITSIVDTYKKEKVIYYKVNLQLTDIETTEVVWIGDKEIKKYVNK